MLSVRREYLHKLVESWEEEDPEERERFFGGHYHSGLGALERAFQTEIKELEFLAKRHPTGAATHIYGQPWVRDAYKKVAQDLRQETRKITQLYDFPLLLASFLVQLARKVYKGNQRQKWDILARYVGGDKNIKPFRSSLFTKLVRGLAAGSPSILQKTLQTQEGWQAVREMARNHYILNIPEIDT